jgi:hypothetical protein
MRHQLKRGRLAKLFTYDQAVEAILHKKKKLRQSSFIECLQESGLVEAVKPQRMYK